MQITAYVPVASLSRIGGQIAVADGTGRTVGKVDLIRGFAYYTGTKGSAHEGVTAVVRGGIDGLVEALAAGLRSGRDDRR